MEQAVAVQAPHPLKKFEHDACYVSDAHAPCGWQRTMQIWVRHEPFKHHIDCRDRFTFSRSALEADAPQHAMVSPRIEEPDDCRMSQRLQPPQDAYLTKCAAESLLCPVSHRAA